MDDRQLMASIAGGDEAALQSLLRRFTPMLRYILRPLLPDERDREARRGDDVPLEDTVPHSGGSAEDALLRREQRARLRAVIAALPVQERDLFYRKYYYCQSTAQMAAELSLTERAVEGRLYRLRQSLRQQLGGDFCDG